MIILLILEPARNNKYNCLQVNIYLFGFFIKMDHQHSKIAEEAITAQTFMQQIYIQAHFQKEFS